MKKRYISAFSLMAFGLVSNNNQLENFTPTSMVRPFKEFQYETGTTLFSDWPWPVSLCFGYLISVFLLKKMMKDKEVVDLKWFRIIHNAFLCWGSLLMVFGLVKELSLVFQKHGLEALWCDSNNRQMEGNLYFWYYVFFLSKFYEFIDTFILIVRQKDISFLHCFHHFITAFLCWNALYWEIAVQWIVIILNASVHVFMYYYYLAQTLDQDVWWKKYLTTAQIIQFLIDISLTAPWFYLKLNLGMNCSGTTGSLIFTHSVLFSFIALFVNFYLHTYKKQPTSDKTIKRN